MKRILVVLTVLTIVVLGSSPAFAKGLYVGAGIGNTFHSSTISLDEIEEEVKKIEENATHWKIFGGFSGHRFMGVEGGYREFGTVETEHVETVIKSKVKGWDIEALGRLQITIVDVFVKAGVMFWSSEGIAGQIPFDDSGTDVLWGLGAGVHLGPIGVRLEWESLEQRDVENLSVVSLGATFGF